MSASAVGRINGRAAFKREKAPRVAVPSEHSEAVQLMYLARLHEAKHPELRWLFAVPNGGHRNKAAAGKLKAEGVKSGVPDYLMPVTKFSGMTRYCGLALELKRTKRSQTSSEQSDWLNHFDDQGWRAVVCKGHEHAWAVICDYLGIPNCLERAA